jgi:hypothetical protein
MKEVKMTTQNQPAAQNQKSLRLTLDSGEIDKISVFARDNKFDVKGVSILYADDPVQKLDAFIKAYRLIFNLSGCAPEESIKSKLNQFLAEGDVMFSEALKLADDCKRSVPFNISRVRRKVFDFLLTHKSAIDSLMDVVIPLGKVVKQYDPGKTQGYY